MITNPVLTNQSKSGNGQEPTNIQRRTLIGGALAALLSSSVQVMAEDDGRINDPFILLLHGLYQPVGVDKGPANNLGLSAVNLSDGSYSRTRIYPIFEFRKTRTRTGQSATFSCRSQLICVPTSSPAAPSRCNSQAAVSQ
jgi:hypothetical protein